MSQRVNFIDGNAIFKWSLLFSFLLHAGILARLSYSNTHYTNKPIKQTELIYRSATFLSKQPESQIKPLNKMKRGKLGKRVKVLVKEKFDGSPLLKDMAEIPSKLSFHKKSQMEIKRSHLKPKISVATVRSEKMNNPHYMGYNEVIRNKIKEYVYLNYSRSDTGELYITFALSSDGRLKQIKIIEDRTSASQYLKNVGLKSIQEASPFPPFPENLSYPELTFNIAISFKIRD